MIKNVIFDNGGVIVKYSAEHYLDYFGYDPDKQRKLSMLFSSQEWEETSKGHITMEDFSNHCKSLYPEWSYEIDEMLDIKNLKYLIPVYPEMINFVKDLKKDGFKVFMLTDIVETTIEYLNQEIENFEKLWDGLVYSCRVGMVKREGKVFDYILDKYNLKANECLFLDDSKNKLEQAKIRGIECYQFLDPSKDLEIVKNIIKNSQK